MIKVFCIHGMGEHSEDWWTKAGGVGERVKALPTYDSAPIRHDGNAVNRTNTIADFCHGVNFIDVHYDDKAKLLYQTADKDADNISKLLEFIKADPGIDVDTAALENWVESDKNKLKSAKTFAGSGFVNTHLWDVLLCTMSITRNYLAIYVAEQILKNLRDGDEWAVIAHSLGTAVVHDALNIVHDELQRRHEAGEFVTFIRARVVLMLSNFCTTVLNGPPGHAINHILTYKNPVLTNETHVWPGYGNSKSVCDAYISCRHRLDPLSYLSVDMKYKFHQASTKFQHRNLHILTHAELHDLPREVKPDVIKMGSYLHSVEHYFSHPEIYLRFFSYVHSKNWMKKSILEKASIKYANLVRADLETSLPDLIPKIIPSTAGQWAGIFAKHWINFKAAS